MSTVWTSLSSVPAAAPLLPLLLLLSSTSTSTSTSTISLSHGGYDGVTVAFSPQMAPPENCSQLLDNVEASVREASRMLHQATEGRLFFRTAAVVLPAGWNGSECSRAVGGSRLRRFDDAEFRVAGAPHPLFGDAAWTQQSRDCGQSGDYVSLTAAFFNNNNNNNNTSSSSSATDHALRGRRLLREWAKLRYGVFDEVGYYQDGLYPSFYNDSGATTPTGCTDAPVHGHRLGSACDSDNPDDCVFHPTGDNSQVHSSILSYGHLSNVTQFCDASNHNDLAPTKQNLLCQGRSAKDVIFSHSDLTSAGPEPVERLETVFEFVQPVRSRYVLALDKSTPMDERDHWKYVRSATRRFVLQDAGGGTELGILSFADAVDVHTDGLVDLSDHGVREAVASAIPVFLTQSASNTVVQDSCLVCAITQAISMLEKGGTGSAAGDVILLVTSGTAGADQVQAALALAAAAKVHVSVVAFAYPSSAGSSPALRQLQSLTDASGGLMTTIAAKGVGYMSHISMLIELGDALLSALHFHERSAELSDLPVLVHQREFGESASGWVNGSFYLDPTLGRETTLAVYFYSRDFNTHVGDIRLISPDGTEHRGISEVSMASLYVTPLASIDKTGVWRYSFDRRSQSHQSHFVKVTSKLKQSKTASASQRGALTARLQIVGPADDSDASAPFVLLATVKSGQLPVLDARVRAIISYTGRSVSQDQANNTVVVDLYDNGNADPDITKGDGVYSRYFAKFFRGAGTYSIKLSVDAMDGRAYSIRASSVSSGNMECCGSEIRVPAERRELTGPFNRIVAGGILTVRPASLPPPASSANGSAEAAPASTPTAAADVTPPARVTDLRAGVDAAEQRVVFTWTAVGDDFDQGAAAVYELRLTPNRSELRHADTFAQVELLPFAAPEVAPQAGAEVRVGVEMRRCDAQLYAALRARDAAGNAGRVSNVVGVLVPCPPPPTTAEPTLLWSAGAVDGVDGAANHLGKLGSLAPGPQWFSGGLSAVHWAAIVASSCVALLVLVLAVYFVVDAKRRKQKEMKETQKSQKFAFSPAVNSTLYAAANGEKDSVSVDVKDTASTIYDGKMSTGVVNGGVGGVGVPVHWSASQLLQEHERRHSPYGHADYLHAGADYTPSVNGGGGYGYAGGRDSSVFSGSYHLNTASAVYDQEPTPASAGVGPGVYYGVGVRASASATPPSESLASLPNMAEYRSSYSVDYEASSLDQHVHSQLERGGRGLSVAGKLGPLLSSLPLQGSFTSLASERKKRNVTQV